MLLAGDIGGTKTNLAFFEEGSFEPLELLSYASASYPDLESIILEYLKTKERVVTTAVFALAGPVREEVCEITNLPWIIDARLISKRVEIPYVYLLNDLEANAYAVDILPKDNLIELNRGKKIRGNRAVISPGTGLGEAGMYWDGKEFHAFASEGGHSDFAPLDSLQDELLVYLRAQFGHVSFERLSSGPGLHNIYNFLIDAKKREEIEEVKKEMTLHDPSFVISTFALNNRSKTCLEALNLFVKILGQEASNVALKFLALSGLYLGGGIPPKILPKLKEPLFMEAFLNKGRFKGLLQDIPIHVIADDKASLKGAASFATLKVRSQKSKVRI